MADLGPLSREELIAVVEGQRRLIAELTAEIERLKRAQNRSAAPFSKNKPKADPQRPGRRPGQGPFLRRTEPVQLTSTTVVAEVPSCCPACGGQLEQERVEVATTIDIPANPQPVVTVYQVPHCRCQKCGKRVRGTAPGLAPDQIGATAHRVGPGVMAAAHALHYGSGVPVRKVPAVLKELTGISITQSALTQDALRRAERGVGAEYERLRQMVPAAPVIHTDDTGWRVGGRTAFLMGFDTDQATVYQIRDQHRNEEVREVIGDGYDGVLVSDRGKSYEAKEFAGMQQQKCLSHLLRNISEVVEAKRGRARQFGTELKAVLREGLDLWHVRDDLSSEEFSSQAWELDQVLTYLLRDRILRDPDNQRLLDGIGLQQDRGRLLTFLNVEGVEPTNNRAERILRPAVIARKVSHCSKNQRGAEAFAAFASIIQTARKTVKQTATQVLRTLFSPIPALSLR
jgi:transposase